MMNLHRYNKIFYLEIVYGLFELFICVVWGCITYNFHCCMFPIKNSIFTSQYPLTTHTTSAVTNYNLPTHTVTYFQLTIPYLNLSIPWPHTPHLPYQIITSQLPLLHYFLLTILHIHLSIPWPHTPHLPYQIITSQLPLLHISN